MRSMGVEVALDFFPAQVVLPSGVQLRPVRLIVANGIAEVYILKDGVPQLYWSSPLIEHSGNPVRGYDIATEEGPVRMTKARGCGCGNPLRNYNPWPDQQRVLVAL